MAKHEGIENIAAKYGFEQTAWDENTKRITFQNEKHHIDIYLTKMTIGHKKIGESQQFLYRKNLTVNQIEDYFIELTGWNMREETPLDYWKKRCLLAEDFINNRTAPIDRPEEFKASEKWKLFKNKKPPN